MELLTVLALLFFGFLVGIFSILIGIGGGLVYNPLLIFVYHLDPKLASVISSFVIIFTSGSGYLKYRSMKRVDLKITRAFLVYAVPGAVFGALLGVWISVVWIKFLFAIFIGASAIRGIIKASRLDSQAKQVTEGHEKHVLEDSEGTRLEYYVNMKTRPLAFIGGLVAGLLGVGGGIIFSPLLITLTGLPVQVAVATSSSIIPVVSFVALITKIIGLWNTGLLDVSTFFFYGIPLAIGAVFGARFGASKITRIKSKVLLITFWSVAFVSAIRMGIGANIF